MSAVSFAQDTLPPAIFEDLIEALQDWRLSKSEHDCLHVAKLIVSGCKKASRETSISALGSAFEAFLRPPPSFRSFIDGSAPIPTPLVPTPFSAKTEIVDDAAQKVLEYVVEHGTLPPDPDSPDPDTLRPLSTVTPSFLPPDTFITLCKAVKSHPALFSTSSSSLGEGFANTEGFIFRFSKAGIPKLRCHIWAEPLLPFFDASLDSSSNAFVLNVLNCLPTSKPAGYAVDWHRDATLALRPEAAMVNIKPRLAFSVSVLYLSVPQDIKGGELHLRNVSRPLWRRSDDKDKEIDHRIPPRENNLCVFRGDAEHAVQKFNSERKENRISVVLEQYKVPIADVSWLLDFEVVDQRNYLRVE